MHDITLYMDHNLSQPSLGCGILLFRQEPTVTCVTTAAAATITIITTTTVTTTTNSSSSSTTDTNAGCSYI